MLTEHKYRQSLISQNKREKIVCFVFLYKASRFKFSLAFTFYSRGIRLKDRTSLETIFCSLMSVMLRDVRSMAVATLATLARGSPCPSCRTWLPLSQVQVQPVSKLHIQPRGTHRGQWLGQSQRLTQRSLPSSSTQMQDSHKIQAQISMSSLPPSVFSW